ncbi:hypothetical protein [Periweissella cryptocerci]|nr:hypothetical protein [Periweissella cryptocerci]
MINKSGDTSEQNCINMEVQVRTQAGLESFDWETDITEVFRDLA